MTCSACGAAMEPAALSCPACRRLTHAAALEDLAKRAGAAWRIGDFTLERTLWVQSLPLLPEDTVQHRTIRARIDEIDQQRSASARAARNGSRSGSCSRATLARRKSRRHYAPRR